MVASVRISTMTSHGGLESYQSQTHLPSQRAQHTCDTCLTLHNHRHTTTNHHNQNNQNNHHNHSHSQTLTATHLHHHNTTTPQNSNPTTAPPCGKCSVLLTCNIARTCVATHPDTLCPNTLQPPLPPANLSRTSCYPCCFDSRKPRPSASLRRGLFSPTRRLQCLWFAAGSFLSSLLRLQTRVVAVLAQISSFD